MALTVAKSAGTVSGWQLVSMVQKPELPQQAALSSALMAQV
ncbi:MAG: hypothetical protein OXC13_10470 [Caldilineaceae bacterium]|nr:hypothetical protein [Caldilineaceae bacterium]